MPVLLRGCCQLRGASAARLAFSPRPHRKLFVRQAAPAPPGSTSEVAAWDLTVELPVGELKASERQLLEQPAFMAQVQPDLPFATTWDNLLRRWASPAAATDRKATTITCPSGRLHVHTVAGQLRSEKELIDRMLWACGTATTSMQGQQQEAPPATHLTADALLVVSGSHPARALPVLPRLLHTTPHILRLAGSLRQRGDIPPTTRLWATANPCRERDAAYLHSKVEAGAEVILTQPPLLWPAFERWLDDAARRRITHSTRLVVGLPVLTSSGSAAFWLALCRLPATHPEAVQLLSSFRDAEAAGPEALEAFALQWATNTAARVRQLSRHVAGLHLMPVTLKGARLALRLLHTGALQPPAP